MHNDDERTLSPKERQLREFERKAEASRKFREELGDFNDEEKAERYGYLLNKPTRSVSKSSRKGGFLSKICPDAFGAGAIGLNEVFGIIGAFNKGIGELIAAPAAVADSKSQQERSASIDADHDYEDATHIYSTRMVSQQTARALERESQIIAAKLRELNGAENPEIREELALKIEALAEEFQMQQHPRTMVYVHNLDRILELEGRLKPQERDCRYKVCIVAVKAELGDARRVGRAIGDQFNDDVEEVILNRDEKLAVAAAAPALNLH